MKLSQILNEGKFSEKINKIKRDMGIIRMKFSVLFPVIVDYVNSMYIDLDQDLKNHFEENIVTIRREMNLFFAPFLSRSKKMHSYLKENNKKVLENKKFMSTYCRVINFLKNRPDLEVSSEDRDAVFNKIFYDLDLNNERDNKLKGLLCFIMKKYILHRGIDPNDERDVDPEGLRAIMVKYVFCLSGISGLFNKFKNELYHFHC
jgi:hypothetical protein